MENPWRHLVEQEIEEHDTEHANAVRALSLLCLRHCLQAIRYDDGSFGDIGQLLDALRELFSRSECCKLSNIVQSTEDIFDVTLHEGAGGSCCDDGSEIVFFTERGHQVRTSHLKGEVFELLCALMFKYRGLGMVLLDHDAYLDREYSDGDYTRFCKIKRIFLSEKEELDESLKWPENAWLQQHNNEYTKELFQKLASCHPVRRTNLADCELFVENLMGNIKNDSGLDLVLELEDAENGSLHFLVAQCKYRTFDSAEIDMTRYLAKHYVITQQLRKINRNRGGGTLCPFYWLTTQSEPDSMQYWKDLMESGLLRFHGLHALQGDVLALNIFPKVLENLNTWIDASQKHMQSSREISITPRSLRYYQEETISRIIGFCENKRRSLPDRISGSVVMGTGSGKTLTAFEAVIALEKRFSIQKPSLHVSPMIRLVLQNAHEWLAQDLGHWCRSGKNEDELPIYYAVCSQKKDFSSQGSTSVRLITTDRLLSVFRKRVSDGSINRCRFFTTKQSGWAFWMTVRKIAMEIYKISPCYSIFGVAVRDEAHEYTGPSSRDHSAVLNIPAIFNLNFTATPKVHEVRATQLQPYNEAETLALEKYGHYCTLKHSHVIRQFRRYDSQHAAEVPVHHTGDFHQVDQPEDTCSLADSATWHAMDMLSKDMLFKMVEENKNPIYDWTFFQKKSRELNKQIVVFEVGDKVQIEANTFWDIYLEENYPLYFGTVQDGTEFMIRKRGQTTLCFGVSRDRKQLFETNGPPRGYLFHDMSSLGSENYIGPMIHCVSYHFCIQNGYLVKPKLVVLEPHTYTFEEYSRFSLKRETLAHMLGISVSENIICPPTSLEWRLTISGKVFYGKMHQFRAMKMLVDILDEAMMESQGQKAIHHPIVFCSDGEKAKLCMKIFTALAQKYLSEEIKSYHIFSSTTFNGKSMSFAEQQRNINWFKSDKKAVLFNSKLIGIGVDMPVIDAVLNVESIQSISQITQKYGRAMRKNRSEPEKQATFIVPALSPYYNPKMDLIVEDSSEIQQLTSSLDSQLHVQEDASGNQVPGTANFSISRKNCATPVQNIRKNGPKLFPYTISADADEDQSPLSTPIHFLVEESFYLPILVARGLCDADVRAITETVNVKHPEGTFKILKDKATTGKDLVGRVKGESKGSEEKYLPVFDESLSELLLSAWETKVIPHEKIHGEVRPAQLDPMVELKRQDEEERLQSSRFVVFFSACRAAIEENFSLETKFSNHWFATNEPIQGAPKLKPSFHNLEFKSGGGNASAIDGFRHEFLIPALEWLWDGAIQPFGICRVPTTVQKFFEAQDEKVISPSASEGTNKKSLRAILSDFDEWKDLESSSKETLEKEMSKYIVWTAESTKFKEKRRKAQSSQGGSRTKRPRTEDEVCDPLSPVAGKEKSVDPQGISVQRVLDFDGN